VIAVKPNGSKLARAEAVSASFEAGRVFFPAQSSRWRDELLEELASFPSGKHDDLTDAIVYAIQRLRPIKRSAGRVAGVVVHRRLTPRERDARRPLSELDPRYA
jgi:phage terminase large subunit-like protein